MVITGLTRNPFVFLYSEVQKSGVIPELFNNQIILAFYGFQRKFPKTFGMITVGKYWERYRRGHNGADSKSVCEQSHMGSNPILSAKKPWN